MSNRAPLIELLSGIGLIAGDIFIVLSVFGSALLLIIALIRGRAEHPTRATEQLWLWSLGGLIFGALVTLPLLSSASPITRVGLAFSLSLPAALSLLALSAALLFLRRFARRSQREKNTPKHD
jgi:uncharacterized membrane protein YdcZ (DUF606 family)